MLRAVHKSRFRLRYLGDALVNLAGDGLHLPNNVRVVCIVLLRQELEVAVICRNLRAVLVVEGFVEIVEVKHGPRVHLVQEIIDVCDGDVDILASIQAVGDVGIPLVDPIGQLRQVVGPLRAGEAHAVLSGRSGRADIASRTVIAQAARCALTRSMNEAVK